MAWEIATDELLARYNAGERNFAGIELIRIPERDGISGSVINGLEGADLRGINLRGANFEEVELTGADLTGGDLFGAYLGGACLHKAILRDANLFSANLNHAIFSGADLGGANLSRVHAVSAAFIGAKVGHFEYADLTDANFQWSTANAYGLCRSFNLIWRTTMPDGTVEEGPYYKWR